MALLNFGPLSLATSPERDNFAALRRRYNKLGENHRRQFYDHYTAFKTADDLFKHMPVALENILTETSSLVINDFAANRIFDVSEKSIRANLETRAEGVAGRFNRMKDQYLEIIQNAEKLEVDRQEASDNRGGVIGGGFGVEGAVGGIVIATIANTAIDLLHGLTNLAEKAVSDLGDKEKKRQLLMEPTTKFDVGDFLVQTALQGCELVAEAVNSHIGKPAFETVTPDSREKSAAIVANVVAGRVPDQEVQSILIQALALDPFNEEAWMVWLEHFGDQDGGVSVSADLLGITEVKSHKARLVAEHKDQLAWDTPEECQANSIILKQYAEWLGFPFDDERKWIEDRAAELDIERRTFKGVLYPSQAEMVAAQQAHEDEGLRTVGGVVYPTIAEADEARAGIIAASRSAGFGWFVLAYRRFRDIKGRSCRKEFFMFALFVTTSLIVLALVTPGTPMTPAAIFALQSFGFASVIAALTLQIRRFHDQDRSGWFVLLNMIPTIGWLIVLVFMLVDGTPGDNRFGPSPKKTLQKQPAVL